jgi:hypothetical protein
MHPQIEETYNRRFQQRPKHIPAKVCLSDEFVPVK